MIDNRSDKMKEKYPYTKVTYSCPGCGREASQKWTKTMNDLWLKQIKGTFCPDCDRKRGKT